MVRYWKIGVLCLALCASSAAPAPAQYGQGFLDGTLASSAVRAVDAMREWHQAHGSLPSSDADLRALLLSIYQRISGTSPSQPMTYEGNSRVLGTIRLTLDPTIRNAPIAVWKTNPPENWMQPANSTNILIDGEHQYVIWTAELNGAPMRDANKK